MTYVVLPESWRFAVVCDWRPVEQRDSLCPHWVCHSVFPSFCPSDPLFPPPSSFFLASACMSLKVGPSGNQPETSFALPDCFLRGETRSVSARRQGNRGLGHAWAMPERMKWGSGVAAWETPHGTARRRPHASSLVSDLILFLPWLHFFRSRSLPVLFPSRCHVLSLS